MTNRMTVALRPPQICWMIGILILCLAFSGCSIRSQPIESRRANLKEQMRTGDINPAQFAKVQPGMTKAELLSLVGPPQEGIRAPSGGFFTSFLVNYGELTYEHPAFPSPMPFRVGLSTKDNSVVDVEQPFSLPVLLNQLPVPELLTPRHLSEIQHYPRYVDFRWKPCFSELDVAYEIELWSANPSSQWDDIKRLAEGKLHPNQLIGKITTEVPYVAFELIGKGRYLWRVRARTALIEGPWSEVRLVDSAQ